MSQKKLKTEQELASELLNLRLSNRDLEVVIYKNEGHNYKKAQEAQITMEANNKRIDEILAEALARFQVDHE